MKNNLLLRNHDFRRVWIGQVLSQAGSRAYLINLLWWIVSRPGSTETMDAAWASGILLMITGLPSVILVGAVSRVMQRYRSQVILVTAEGIGALLVLTVLALSWFDSLSLTALFIISGLLAICQGLVDPTLIKSVGELVAPEDMEQAVAFESSTQALAYFAGAAAGAMFTGFFGFNATIALNFLSYLVSAGATARARFRDFGLPGDESVGMDAPESVDLKEAGVFGLLRAFAAANFFMFPLFLILPLYIKNTIHGSAIGLGLLEACFWIGLVVGAGVASKVPHGRSFHGLAGRAFVLFGFATLSIGWVSAMEWVAVVLFLGGLSAGVVNVKVVTYFQAVVPDATKPSFFAKMQAYISGVQPLSYFVFSALLAVLLPVSGFLVAGVGLVCVGCVCLYLAPRPAGKAA